MNKKVLVFESDLLPFSETFIKEQILAYSRWHGVLVGNRRVPGLSLTGLDIRLLQPDPPAFFDRFLSRVYSRLRIASRSSIDLLRNEEASLFHAHFGPVAVAAWPLAKELDLPVVVTLHGTDINTEREWWESGNSGRTMKSYPRLLLELAQQPRVHFIAVSEAIRQRAVDYGIPPEKVTVRYIGIDTDKFKPGTMPVTERRKRVLFVGRLVEKKGCEYLIRAFVQVQKAIPKAELVIVGEGELRDSLEKLARELHVSARFHGALGSENVKCQIDKARALCLPSTTAEGLGLVILEAQACGVPIVTSAQGGALEAFKEGQTGFSFPEKNISALAEKLIILLRDDELASSMSRNSRAFVIEKFTIAHCTEGLENLYDQLTEQVY